MRYRQSRKASGQAIAEGTVALWLIISSSVLGLALVFNAGALMYQQQKLSFFCYQLAQYASAVGVNPNTQGQVTGYSNFLAKELGLKCSKGYPVIDGNQTIKLAGLNDSLPAVSVTVKCSWVPFFGELGFFKNLTTLSSSITLPTPLTSFNNYNTLLQVNPVSDYNNAASSACFLIPAFGGTSLSAFKNSGVLPYSTAASSSNPLPVYFEAVIINGAPNGVLAGPSWGSGGTVPYIDPNSP